jgi:hypothetical protein
MDLISDLKSVRKDSGVASLPDPSLSEEEISSNDIIDALAGTLLSPVDVQGEGDDKRSKLSIDAALLFDAPEEVEFFERQFTDQA